MAWLCVNEKGIGQMFKNKLIRRYEKESFNYWFDFYFRDDNVINLPKGTIKKITGRDLTWLDEPIELK